MAGLVPAITKSVIKVHGEVSRIVVRRSISSSVEQYAR